MHGSILMSPPPSTLRILHVSDLHFRRAYFRWITAAARTGKYHAVAISGDLIGRLDVHGAEHQVAWIRKWITQSFPREVHLLISSGNHDGEDNDLPPLREWVGNLKLPNVTSDGQHLQLAQWNFECVPWSEVPVRGGPHQVTLCHAPPTGLPTAVSYPENVDFGDFELSELLRYPPPGYVPPCTILSGHVHRGKRPFARIGDCVSMNPSTGDSPTMPNFNVLTLGAEKQTAEWHASDGRREIVSLGKAHR